MNDSGNIIAVGVPSTNDGRGYVRVYQHDGNDWTPHGPDINGETEGDLSGFSIALNGEGNRVAIGAPYNSGDPGIDSGHVRVWQYAGQWYKLGQDIDGRNPGEFWGDAVSMNTLGDRVVVSSTLADTESGCVRVFRLNNDNIWELLGDEICGEADEDQSGYSVSMNGDGTRIAIGAPFNDGSAIDNRGHVRVWQFNEVENIWSKIGQDIDGEVPYNESGWSVQLSENGDRVVIGSYECLHVWQYNETSRLWYQIGQKLEQGNVGVVSINATGDRIICTGKSGTTFVVKAWDYCSNVCRTSVPKKVYMKYYISVGADDPGRISLWANGASPDSSKWLPCEGQSLLMSNYDDLYNVIGTAYGGGGTQFALPDMRGAIPHHPY